MLETVISGFQSGVDIAAIRAAKVVGLRTGGTMPRGFLTEDGPRPEYAELYGATEHPSQDYPPRTRANIDDADATLIIETSRHSRGTALTIRLCQQREPKPFFRVGFKRGQDGAWMTFHSPASIALWIQGNGVRALNVAGPRASTSPGLSEAVETWLVDVFRLASNMERMPHA